MNNSRIRRAAVAGAFYSADPGELSKIVSSLLREEVRTEISPRALIVPHAGYVYSGAVAGSAFAKLKSFVNSYNSIVLLGPAHRVPVAGMAYSSADFFETPLGLLKVHEEKLNIAKSLDCVQLSDEAHQSEHSLEVQLPFIQMLFENINILPLLVGNISHAKVAACLDALVDEQTLVVVSSDLSHFLDYDTASFVDKETSQAILRLDADSLSGEEACGALPISALLLFAKSRGLSVEKIQQINSGDVSGDHSRVVGYGSWAFYDAN